MALVVCITFLGTNFIGGRVGNMFALSTIESIVSTGVVKRVNYVNRRGLGGQSRIT